MHVLERRHAGRLVEAAGEGALGQAAHLSHRGDRRRAAVVAGDPGLAAGDDGILDLPRACQPRERLLADVVPVDEVHARDLHGGVDADATRDQVQREIEP